MKVQPDTLTERPTRRADARRNHDRILAAARAAFENPDAHPSMAEISRRAGVGMATLYSNFPTRLELLEALYSTEADAAFTTADVATGATPGESLRSWLTQFFTFAARKKNVAAELLSHVDSDSPIFDDAKTRVIAAGRPLFDAAQRAHQIQHDLSIEQILQMLVSIAAIDGGSDYQEPLLRTVLDGLKPHPGLTSANDADPRRRDNYLAGMSPLESAPRSVIRSAHPSGHPRRPQDPEVAANDHTGRVTVLAGDGHAVGVQVRLATLGCYCGRLPTRHGDSAGLLQPPVG